MVIDQLIDLWLTHLAAPGNQYHPPRQPFVQEWLWISWRTAYWPCAVLAWSLPASILEQEQWPGSRPCTPESPVKSSLVSTCRSNQWICWNPPHLHRRVLCSGPVQWRWCSAQLWCYWAQQLPAGSGMRCTKDHIQRGREDLPQWNNDMCVLSCCSQWWVAPGREDNEAFQLTPAEHTMYISIIWSPFAWVYIQFSPNQTW